jgi:ribosomal protein S18 acetylase RimI-like enzyme
MVNIECYDSKNPIIQPNKEELVGFLFEALGKYGDTKKDIAKAINYSMSADENAGGFILVAVDMGTILGVVVVNDTGMSGYVPEHLLVYIAVDAQHRGRKIGSMLIDEAVKKTNGSVALHVEADNPARYLYEKKGFENKYVEMRLIK